MSKPIATCQFLEHPHYIEAVAIDTRNNAMIARYTSHNVSEDAKRYAVWVVNEAAKLGGFDVQPVPMQATRWNELLREGVRA